MVARKIQMLTAAAVEFRSLNISIFKIMVAKATRVKIIPFTCEITDPPGNIFLIKYCSNPGSGLFSSHPELMNNHLKRPFSSKACFLFIPYSKLLNILYEAIPLFQSMFLIQLLPTIDEGPF